MIGGCFFMQDFRRGIEDVLETLRRAHLRGEKATLLVGAGCSVSAGVPLGKEIIQSIGTDFPRAAQRASEQSYAAYIKELATAEQQALINRCVETSQVNSTYLAIAHLLKKGYVDRVLTTNFDPLLIRACALAGEFPAVYNVPQLSSTDLIRLPEKALFYLQGQGTGNTHIPPKPLKAILDETLQSHALIVVGYSGTDSNLFPRLAAQRQFPNRLYWVGYEDEVPAEPVQKRLFKPGKQAYWISGYDSDHFFVQLVRQLGVFSTDFADRLLEHPQAVLETLSPAAQPDQLLERVQPTKQPQPKDVHPSFISSQLREADELVLRAQLKASREADTLFEAAYARYAGALTLQPDDSEILVQWAMALSEQAKLKSGTGAANLLSAACEKYAEAVTQTPSDFNAVYLLGMALSRRAQLTRGEESQILVEQAYAHLSQADELKPGIAAYFLACLCGARGDQDGIKHWLGRCQKHGVLPMRGMVESNPAFRQYVGQRWFTALFKNQ
jgi:tetratricopeptide (TPR) repeat protein